MSLGGAEDRGGERLVTDGTCEAHGAHPQNRDGERIVAVEARLLARSIDERRDLLSEHGSKLRITTRCVSGERRRRTSTAGLVHVGERQVALHHVLELRSAADISAGTEQGLDLQDKGMVERRSNERVLVLEVRVKAAPRQTRFLHERVDADARRALLAEHP